MEFHAEHLEAFHEIYAGANPKIAAFSGCNGVDLCTDPSNPNVRYTFSKWDSEMALEDYRNSELFQSTWAKTKVLFSAKPLAYSLITAE